MRRHCAIVRVWFYEELPLSKQAATELETAIELAVAEEILASPISAALHLDEVEAAVNEVPE